MAWVYSAQQQRAMLQAYWRDEAMHCAECGASMQVQPISLPTQPTEVVVATCPQCQRTFRGHGPTGSDEVWSEDAVNRLLEAIHVNAPLRCPNDGAALELRRERASRGILIILRCPNCGQRAGRTMFQE